VENNTLGERLAKVEAKAILADRLVAVEFDTLADKLCMVKAVAVADTVAYRVKEVHVKTMLHTCEGGRREAYIRTC